MLEILIAVTSFKKNKKEIEKEKIFILWVVRSLEDIKYIVYL